MHIVLVQVEETETVQIATEEPEEQYIRPGYTAGEVLRESHIDGIVELGQLHRATAQYMGPNHSKACILFGTRTLGRALTYQSYCPPACTQLQVPDSGVEREHHLYKLNHRLELYYADVSSMESHLQWSPKVAASENEELELDSKLYLDKQIRQLHTPSTTR